MLLTSDTINSSSQHFLYFPDGSVLSLRHSVLLEGRLKIVSALCLESSRKKLLIGTEGGNIYQLRLQGFCLEEEIIFQVCFTHENFWKRLFTNDCPRIC